MSTYSYEPLAERYIILRAPVRRAQDFQPNLMAVSEPVPEVQVDIDDHVDKSTLNILANDATVVGFSPVMPMKLIEPVDLEESEDTEAKATSEAEVTWGVEAVGTPRPPSRVLGSPLLFSTRALMPTTLLTGVNGDQGLYNQWQRT